MKRSKIFFTKYWCIHWCIWQSTSKDEENTMVSSQVCQLSASNYVIQPRRKRSIQWLFKVFWREIQWQPSWWFQASWKICAFVKLENFSPRIEVKIQKDVKPPPSNYVALQLFGDNCRLSSWQTSSNLSRQCGLMMTRLYFIWKQVV